VICLGLCACTNSSKPTQQNVEEHYISVPNSVAFDIEPMQTDGSIRQWLATSTSQGKTAKFRIELSASKPLADKEPLEFDVGSGKGRFISEPGSDASVLLLDLKKALEATAVPPKVQHVHELPFQFVSFGNTSSQALNGGFQSKPPGHWTPMKIFIGEGREEGEVFLNLNPVIKKGQFSIKDEENGDITLGQLARVL
jgi:hypothetical protein